MCKKIRNTKFQMYKQICLFDCGYVWVCTHTHTHSCHANIYVWVGKTRPVFHKWPVTYTRLCTCICILCVFVYICAYDFTYICMCMYIYLHCADGCIHTYSSKWNHMKMLNFPWSGTPPCQSPSCAYILVTTISTDFHGKQIKNEHISRKYKWGRWCLSVICTQMRGNRTFFPTLHCKDVHSSCQWRWKNKQEGH